MPAPSDAYLETKVLTARPEELRLLLLDGAIKFCRQGRDGLAKKNYEACFVGFDRCRAIIVELINTTKKEPNPQLHERITALYLYMISCLLQASHRKDVSKADEVIKLLEYDRDTWTLLVAKANAERTGAATTPGAAARAMPHQHTPPHERPALSIQA